jgi:glycosyltransferase involved in cell wall biosynthesis
MMRDRARESPVETENRRRLSYVLQTSRAFPRFSDAMILGLITPYYFPSVRGNSITVQRIESGLRDHGITVQVFSLDQESPEKVHAGLLELQPQVVHGFHATATGPLVVEASRQLRVPAAVTLTGTDVNHDLLDPARRLTVLETLGAVQAIVVFHESVRSQLLQECPTVGPRVHVIGQAVQCGEDVYDLRNRLGLTPADIVFFQAAGIRPVKNIPSVIPPLTRLQAHHPRLKYVLAGPVLDEQEGARVQALLHGLPWAFHLGTLTHDEICAALTQVEVAVNSSLSEGGMSNAVLEAMSKGIPVLASDIPGNRSIIQNGVDGFLYDTEAAFAARAETLLTRPARRAALGHAARRKIATQFRLEGEIGGHLALYRALLGRAEP